MAATSDTIDQRVASVRAFNRFYTNVIGVLQEGLLRTPYSLAEARVIFELAQRPATDVAELRRTLDLDAGYASRMLARFEADGLVARERSAEDARRQVVSLTKQGRAAFRDLDRRSAREIRALLGERGEREQQRLIEAMGAIERILGDSSPEGIPRLREPHPGELGWVVARHGALYAEEYGWDDSFEALVARVVADFAERRDSRSERAWIAEVDGRPAGCIFCVRKDERTAQLRLLLVEPHARGLGVGGALVAECIRFATEAGYERMTLWTNDVLHAARRVYERAGFELADESPHHSFGHDLVGQTWSRPLGPAA